MRIATWNVERVKPRGWKIAPAQRRRLREVDADIWILTETNIDHGPGAGYDAVHSPPLPELRPDDERWVGIWSRHPIEKLTAPAAQRRGSVSALVTTTFGPVVVYGCVMPYAHARQLADGSPAGMWEAHIESIGRLDRDLEVLRTLHPGAPIIVAGDFNQDRDGSRWYGIAAGRQLLGEVLSRHGLECVTSLDVVAAGLLERHHLVDHICVAPHLAQHATLRCSEPVDDAGVRLSDHPTVIVDLAV